MIASDDLVLLDTNVLVYAAGYSRASKHLA